MKKILFLNILFALMFSTYSFAQDEPELEEEEESIDDYKPSTTFIKTSIVEDKKPFVYADVREDDVHWKKTLWRVIDCREKMNYPLYFPTDSIGSRKSLSQTLIDAIARRKIQAFDDEDLTQKITLEDIMSKLDAKTKTRTEEKLDGTGDTTIVVPGEVKWDQIREFLVREVWFFDKRRSVFEVRIEAICAYRVFSKERAGNEEDDARAEEVKMSLFWIEFPHARKVLANTVCYTGGNESNNLSYDDLFRKRRFESYISAESNDINNRKISTFTRNGVEAIMESNRIKEDLIKKESDFWEY